MWLEAIERRALPACFNRRFVEETTRISGGNGKTQIKSSFRHKISISPLISRTKPNRLKQGNTRVGMTSRLFFIALFDMN